MGELEGKVAIVTGGSSGIGKAIADVFSREGATLVLVARNEEKLKNAVNSLSGNNHSSYSLDLRNTEGLSGFVDNVIKKYEKIDILVNNAGTFAPAHIGEMSAEKISGTFASYEGAVQLTNLIVPIFKQQNKGIILDVLSTSALQVYDGNSVYRSVKIGHMEFSKRIEEELKQNGIKVYRIYPGNTNTALWTRDQTEIKKNIDKDNQLEASDIAEEAFKLIQDKHESHDLSVYPDEEGIKRVEEVK